MAKKKKNSRALAKGAKPLKNDRKHNHVTEHSRTACYRLSLGLYEAVRAEADAQHTSTGKQAMRWLIAGARKAGYEITPETLAFAGL